MQKILFVALLLVCTSLSGTLNASPIFHDNVVILDDNPEMDPQLVEEIIRYLQQNHGYDYQCLCDAYANGDLSIGKTAEGYEVALEQAGGGIVIAIIHEL